MPFKNTVSRMLYSIPGWHTKRHIVVFESDDWGSVRMPSLEVYHELVSKNVEISNKNGYDTNDTLASNDDLELLMDVLSSVKDSNGNPAKITFNCVTANPDFKKIKDSGFSEYHYELFTETMKRYPNHSRSFDLWKEGMAHNMIHPQFHGREHLNAQLWMKLLRIGAPSVIEAFDRGVFSMKIAKQYDSRIHVLSAYNVLNREDYAFACESVREGLSLFEQMFGFKSKSMIAPNYTWDEEIEAVAAGNGVEFMQGGPVQRPSAYAINGGKKAVRHYIGQRNVYGQLYLVRNCFFEPTQDKNAGSQNCLKEIGQAFLMKKPAIVSSHRLNFIGGLNESNRDLNLKDFKVLLQKIVDKYPDVEFLSSDQLGELIQTE